MAQRAWTRAIYSQDSISTQVAGLMASAAQHPPLDSLLRWLPVPTVHIPGAGAGVAWLISPSG